MVEQSNRAAGARFERWFELEVVDPMSDFANPQQEWRRLFSELFGTFLLVIVAAGGGMMSQAFPETISRTAAVVAPGLMVMGIILFMGKVSGAHLNPVVTLAFASRGDFPWRRVPGYILVQLIGATLAAWLLQAIIGVSATYGSNYPGLDFSDYWVYVAGPLAGAGIAVLLAFVLRGYGGGRSGSAAAQGDLGTEVSRPGQA
jgi:aquaporin Z